MVAVLHAGEARQWPRLRAVCPDAAVDERAWAEHLWTASGSDAEAEVEVEPAETT